MCRYGTHKIFHGRGAAPLYKSIIAVSMGSKTRGAVSRVRPHGGRLVHPPITGVSDLVVITSAIGPHPSALIVSGLATITRRGGVRPMVVIAGSSLTPTSRLISVCGRTNFISITISGRANRKINRIEGLLYKGADTFAKGSKIKGASLLGEVTPRLGLTASTVDRGLNENQRAAHRTRLFSTTNKCVTSAPNFSSLRLTVVDSVSGRRLTCYFHRFEGCLNSYGFAAYDRAYSGNYGVIRTIRGNSVRGDHRRDCGTVCGRVGSVGR